MALELHPTLGVNPHLTFCRRCGGETQELVLTGNRSRILKCNNCSTTTYGHRHSEPCPKCRQRGPFTEVGTIGERDKLPASEPCDNCKKEIDEYKQIVAAGGVYWRCLECKQEGVIKPSAFTEAVRQEHNLQAPEPLGVEFNKCAEHGTN